MNSARDEFRAGVYALSPALVGNLPFGLIAGVAGTMAGLTPIQTIASSVLIFSGVGQLIVYQLLGIGSPALVILLAALVVGLRLVMYSAVLAPYFGPLDMRWKILLAYITTDQGFAASASHFKGSEEPKHRAWFHLAGGLTQWVSWQAAVVVGAVLGAQVPPSWSLDFVVPLTFLAMLVPAIKDRGTTVAAIVGGVVALAAIGLPFRLNLITAALLGIAAGFFFDRRNNK